MSCTTATSMAIDAPPKPKRIGARARVVLRDNADRTQDARRQLCAAIAQNDAAQMEQALAQLASVPQTAWLLAFQMACVSVHPTRVAPVLLELLRVKGGTQTRAVVEDASHYLDAAVAHVAAQPTSLYTYALYSAATLTPHIAAPPHQTAVHMPIRLSESVSAGEPCPWDCWDAAMALHGALERQDALLAVQSALALVAAGRVHALRVRRRDDDLAGRAFRKFVKHMLGTWHGLTVLAEAAYRTEVLVYLLVASAARTRGNTPLAAACVAAFQDARNTSAYCSPYALATALVCALVWTPDAVAYAAPNPIGACPPVLRLDPEDCALAHLTALGTESVAAVLERMAAPHAATCYAPCALERRVRMVMAPAWQAAFPAVPNI